MPLPEARPALHPVRRLVVRLDQRPVRLLVERPVRHPVRQRVARRALRLGLLLEARLVPPERQREARLGQRRARRLVVRLALHLEVLVRLRGGRLGQHRAHQPVEPLVLLPAIRQEALLVQRASRREVRLVRLLPLVRLGLSAMRLPGLMARSAIRRAPRPGLLAVHLV